jgi:5'-phosphate synthase pdxT subunit
MRIGILALQGAFLEHGQMLDRLQCPHFEIRQKRDLDGPMDGLILPGGESTAMKKLLRDLDLFEPLDQMIASGLPVFGTCAGLLLLAESIDNNGGPCFGRMHIQAVRNAYGRQLGSFEVQTDFKGIGSIPAVFIRAPYIASVGPNCQVLAAVDEKIVAARERNLLVTAFHPELTDDLSVHKYFLEMCQNQQKSLS